MKIFITGGCGFLGSNLAQYALQSGFDLKLFDNLSRFGSEKNLNWLKKFGDFEFFQNDIRDDQAVSSAIRIFKPDVILHLAGQVAMTTSIENPRADFEINIGGTINVLESVRQHSPNSIVAYSSTNKVYGDLEWANTTEKNLRYICPDFPDGFDEKTPLEFHSPYGCSKGGADQYVLDYARIFDLKTIVFRHSSIFGIRQYSTFDQGWIGWFLSQALLQKENPNTDPFTISGNGKQVRDVLFSDDLVDCYFKAIDSISISRGQAYNIGGGIKNSLSLLELFEFLENSLDIKLKYSELPWRSSDQKVFVADTKKSQSQFGWEPKTSRNDGLSHMLDWVKTNGMKS